MSHLHLANEQLIPFLRELANSIENNELSSNQLQCIGEFFMKYKFIDNINSTDKMDMMKFLVLGWFIYGMIEKTETLSFETQFEDSETGESETEDA